MNLDSASIYSRQAIKQAKKVAARKKMNTDILRQGRLHFELPDATIQGIYQRVLAITGDNELKTAKAKYNAVGKFVKHSGGFYLCIAWRRIRYEALKKYGRKCTCCGREPPQVILHVDHIKPRSKHPELELDINNLQIMCEDCNLGKGNTDEIDYR